MQLTPVAVEYKIARINAVGVGVVPVVDDLTINLRVPLSRWWRFLHKHEIPVGEASEEAVYGCHTELWMLSCSG